MKEENYCAEYLLSQQIKSREIVLDTRVAPCNDIVAFVIFAFFGFQVQKRKATNGARARFDFLT
ncbi:MAG: hypothetical protein JXA82_12580 [Sedimentisphaerales bacterium]|nr:hypothetical protein [Sedimentisphaerales bacterium]